MERRATPRTQPTATSRRRFLAGAAAGTGALLVTGAAPSSASAAAFLDDTFDGVAAFVVPGNDKYSRHQRVSTSSPGGVDLSRSSIEFAANAVITLAALGAYSEVATFDRRTKQLAGRPIGWDLSNYGGVSDGWPEFIGYYQDRTEVTN